MELKVEEIYIEFDKRRKAFEAQKADEQDEEEIRAEMKMLDGIAFTRKHWLIR